MGKRKGKSHGKHKKGEGKQIIEGELKADTNNYILNIDRHLQQLQHHLPPGRAIPNNHRLYNPSTPTIRKIWSDADLDRLLPAQLSVILQPGILPEGSQYQGLAVFPELVSPKLQSPPKTETAGSSAPSSGGSDKTGVSHVDGLPVVGSQHVPKWTYLSGKQREMNDAMLLAGDECARLFAARQDTEDVCVRKKESQPFGLDEECIPDPNPFVAEECGDREYKNTADTLEFNILYTDHSTTLTVGAAVAESMTVAEFLPSKMTEINRFFQSRGLPVFDENRYSYFLIPKSGGTTVVAEWAVQPNAAVVFLPKGRVNEGYYSKCQSIPDLKKDVQALLAKVRFQVKMLKAIHQTLHPFWLSIAAESHCSSWKEWNSSGPSAFSKILRASMLAAEKASVEIEENLHQPLSRLKRAALQRDKTQEQILEEARLNVAGLALQKTLSTSQLSRLRQEMGASPKPLADKEMAHFKNEVLTDNHKYTVQAGPMFKVWGRSFVPYVRKRIMADVTMATKGCIPFPNLDHFSYPNTCGPDWNETLEAIKRDGDAMRYLERLGMTARLLELTRADSWDRMTLLSNVDEAPSTAVHLAIGGYEVCHRVSDEEKAAAITSPALTDYRVPLEKLLRFHRRHSQMSADPDLDKMAVLFFKETPASTSVNA